MVFVCAWCGPKATLATAGTVSHGICNECAALFNKQLDELSASDGGGDSGEASDESRLPEPQAVVGGGAGAVRRRE